MGQRPAKRTKYDNSGIMKYIYRRGDEPKDGTGSAAPQRRKLSDAPKFGGPMYLSKTEKCSSQVLRYRYNNLGAFGAARTVAINGATAAINLQNVYGNYPFMNYNNSYQAGTRAPFFIFGLTRAPQSNGGVSNNSQAYATFPLINPTAGGVQFVPAGVNTGFGDETLYGRASNGTNASDYARYDIGNTDFDQVSVGSSAILVHSDITLQLYGQKLAATDYRIMICQFEDTCIPVEDTDVGSSTSGKTDVYLNTKDNGYFWLDWMKTVMFNPAHRSARGSDVGMKIMFERTIRIEPTQNTDNDGSPQVVTYRLQPWFNRLLNYRWTNPNTAAGEAYVNTNTFNSRQAELQCNVEPKARIYLVVTATNYNVESTQPPGPIANGGDKNPAMDFDIINTFRTAG